MPKRHVESGRPPFTPAATDGARGRFRPPAGRNREKRDGPCARPSRAWAPRGGCRSSGRADRRRPRENPRSPRGGSVRLLPEEPPCRRREPQSRDPQVRQAGAAPTPRQSQALHAPSSDNDDRVVARGTRKKGWAAEHGSKRPAPRPLGGSAVATRRKQAMNPKVPASTNLFPLHRAPTGAPIFRSDSEGRPDMANLAGSDVVKQVDWFVRRRHRRASLVAVENIFAALPIRERSSSLDCHDRLLRARNFRAELLVPI